MPRKTRRAPARAGDALAGPSWPILIVTALAAAALASGLTYALLKPSLSRPAPVTTAATPSPQDALTAANKAFDAKHWQAAVDHYTQAINGGLDNPDLRTDLGTAYRNLKRPQDALAQYAVAQRENPRHENSLLNTGIVYAFDLRDRAKAAEAWHEYLQRFPHGQARPAVEKFLKSLKTSH